MIEKFRRYSRLARIGMAARRVKKAPPHAQKSARRALAEQLGQARGLPMKIGQILAGMGDESEYKDLTQSIEPLPLKKILPILKKAWGHPHTKILQNIEESQAAASLGQVHRAQLLDGTQVAIKVQYPGIAAAISTEISLAGMLPSAGPVKRWGFDLNAYKTTLRENLEAELQYVEESQRQTRFAETVLVENLHIPKIFPNLCTPQVLVQEWVEGQRLSAAASWPLPQRLRIGKALIQTLFKSIFEAGMVHGDPHPGNLLLQPDGERGATLHLLDFGCVVDITPTRRRALLALILSARSEREISSVDGFAALGFNPEKLAYIAPKLRQMIPLLFRPFLEKKPFDTKKWTVGADLSTLLGEQRWWFRSAGPSDLFLLMRAFQGLVKQLELLDIRLPWWPLLTQALSPHLIEEALTWTPPHIKGIETPTIEGAATSLRIRVIRNGEIDIDAAMPAVQALDLEEMIPDHVKAAIHTQGTSLTNLQTQIIQRGLIPQKLFKVTENNTLYEGWME